MTAGGGGADARPAEAVAGSHRLGLSQAAPERSYGAATVVHQDLCTLCA